MEKRFTQKDMERYWAPIGAVKGNPDNHFREATEQEDEMEWDQYDKMLPGQKNMCGFDLILAERKRQFSEEGFDENHDSKRSQITLKIAAHCYLLADGPESPMPHEWPWGTIWWKPKGKLRNVTRAGALYLAAADRVEHGEKDALGIWKIEAKMLRDNAFCCGHIIDKMQGRR